MRVYKVVGYPVGCNASEASIYGFFSSKKDARKYIKVLTFEDDDGDIGYYLWIEKVEMEKRILERMPEIGR